jgi:hypothetical protein
LQAQSGGGLVDNGLTACSEFILLARFGGGSVHFFFWPIIWRAFLFRADYMACANDAKVVLRGAAAGRNRQAA